MIRHLLLAALCIPCVAFCTAGMATTGPKLYATEVISQQLYTLSTSDAAPTLVGRFGVSGYMAGLSYDAKDDILYGTTTASNNLYFINRSTGAATLVGALGVGLMHGIAYDNVNGGLYGVSIAAKSLYRISTVNGHATLVGSLGDYSPVGGDIIGLAFRPTDNTLYGCISSRDSQGGLVRIDTQTGQGTFLFETQALAGISFHPYTGVLYGADNGIGDNPGGLYTIDLENGNATLVGHPELNENVDIAFAPLPEPTPILCLLCGFGYLGGLALKRVQTR